MLKDITDEQRDAALTKASSHQIYLYSNPESGKKLRTLATKNNITDEAMYTKFAIVVGDVILKLIPELEIPGVLAKNLNFSTEKAINITNEIIDFIKEPDTDTVNIESDIEAAEKALASIGNHQEETIHTSTQDTLLNK